MLHLWLAAGLLARAEEPAAAPAAGPPRRRRRGVYVDPSALVLTYVARPASLTAAPPDLGRPKVSESFDPSLLDEDLLLFAA